MPDNSNDRAVCAVIAAAGNSTRMNFRDGGEKSKQFIELFGKTVIERATAVFESCNAVNEIVISAREQDIDRIRKIVSDAGFKKVKYVVAGGKTRGESTIKALSAVSDGIRYVAIHDGARCLVSLSDVEKVIEKAFETGAATAASKITDTIKYADYSDGENIIKNTVDRRFLWSVQTPQVFLKELYLSGIDYINRPESGVCVEEITDDCSILEFSGHRVNIVECAKTNIKITENSDIKLAEAILASLFSGEK